MSTGRVSRIQRRYEENIAKNNQRNFSNYNNNQASNTQRRNNNNNWNRNRQQQQQQQQQGQANTWRESVSNGITAVAAAKPVQRVASLGKAAGAAFKCAVDTTWEEFDFGNNPFQQDFVGDVLEDFNDIVETDPFQFSIKPNQLGSRRGAEAEPVPTANWAHFNAFPQYEPSHVLQAVRYNTYSPTVHTPSTANMTDDDTFFDQGEKMFNVKAVPLAEVIPIDGVEPVFELPHQMPDSIEIDERGGDDDGGLDPPGDNSRTKSARFRPFGGMSKKVQVTVGLPSLKVKSVQDEAESPLRGKPSSPQKMGKPTKEEERLRKVEEKRIKELEEEKEREQERIRRKEERLRREEERLEKERERILEEEERMIREEEERERRREERLKREEEILRVREERKERQRRERDDREFSRIQESKEKKVSNDPFLDFEDVDIEAQDSQEVDWQGFPPMEEKKRDRRSHRRRSRSRSSSSSSSSRSRSRSRRRRSRSRSRRQSRRRRRRSPSPKEPIKISCPTCPRFDCACCPPCFDRHQKWLIPLLVLLVLAAIGLGIYAGVAGPSAFGGEDELSADCNAVLQGFSVPGESLYPTVRLSWVMDISRTEQQATSKVTSAVGSQFQDMVIPTLAGCLMGAPANQVAAARFDVVNGYVRSVRDVGSCRYGEVQPCVRLLVDFVVVVRGDAPVLDLIAHLSSQYTPAVIDAMEQMPTTRKASLVGLFEQRQ